ncbi:MAG: AAA family ATPase, partial [Chloroflexi bacterium]|nr:AAA family ATPase [Chloroflexota bacterium]
MNCPSCAAVNAPGARFCSTCGSALVPAETVERRKTVTVLFADLVESSSMAEGLDPETLATILASYFGAMRKTLERHGGTVEKFIGDAVVGLFGVPVLHEDDALRAVRAALEMRTALARLNDDLGLRYGVRLAARIGINTGEVAVGTGAGESLALGHPVNMAARLEQAAGPDEILAGPATYRLVHGSVGAQAVEPITVKGSREPIPAWRIVGLSENAPRGWQAGGLFVGRDAELHHVRRAFDEAVRDRACVTVTVVAPAGVGKSRLAAEVTASVAPRARVLLGRCVPYGEGLGYAPVADICRQLEAEEGSGALERILGQTADGTAVAGRLRATAQGAADGSPEEMAWSFRRLVEAVADERPVVVVFDDLHWAESVLLELVEYLAVFSVGRPVLLLCLARPDLLEIRPDWVTPRRRSTVLRLDPLSPTETEGLLVGLHEASLDADERRQIVDAAGGVPLFVEQLAALRVDAAATGSSDGIPPTIRALLGARVDGLDRDARTVLERAAIVGEAVEHRRLVSLVPDPVRSALGAHLKTLIRREFIRPERGVAGRDAFRFNHALIRDAVYEQMPRRLRSELHERYAAVIESAGDGDAPWEVIGHHIEAAYHQRLALAPTDPTLADLAVRAGTALHESGRRAVARKESRRAVELLSRATELLRPDHSRRVAALPDLIVALVAKPDLVEADRVHAEAVAASRELGDRTSQLRAEVAWSVSQYMRDVAGWREQAAQAAQQAIDHFSGLADDADLAQAWLLMGSAQLGADVPAAIESLKRAQVHAQRADDEATQISVWDELGGAMLIARTPYPEVLEFMRREVAWARLRGIPFTEADGTLGEAYGLAAAGERQAAREALERVRAVFAQLPGLVTQHGETFTLEGFIEREAGDPAAAGPLYRRAMELFEQGGNRRWWRNAVVGLAHTLLDLDRVEEASSLLDDLAAQTFTASVRADSSQLTAESRLAARRGDLPAALELAGRAIELVADRDAIQAEAHARETLADLLAHSGDGDGARREMELAADLYAEKGY